MTTYTHTELKKAVNAYFLEKTGTDDLLKMAFSNDLLNAFRAIALDLSVESFKTGVALKDVHPIAEMTFRSLDASRTTGIIS